MYFFTISDIFSLIFNYKTIPNITITAFV